MEIIFNIAHRASTFYMKLGGGGLHEKRHIKVTMGDTFLPS